MQSKNILLYGLITGIIMMVLTSSVILTGCSSKREKVYHIGILSGVDAFYPIADGFKSRMTELGYIEGKNIVYDVEKVNADPEKEKIILQKFVDEKVDLIFVFPTESALEAKALTKNSDIPVLFAQSLVEDTGLIDSISSPGNGITGVRNAGVDIIIKRIEMMHELKPEAKRFYITYDPSYPTVKSSIEGVHSAAERYGLTLVESKINSTADIISDLGSRENDSDKGFDAIIIMPDIISQSPEGWKLINDFAARHKIPIAGSAAFEVTDGAVFTYNADNFEMGGLAAASADKIFKGTPAGDIMVISPIPRLSINYNLTIALGLNLSENMISRADKIIR